MAWNVLEVRCLRLGAPFAICHLCHFGQSHSPIIVPAHGRLSVFFDLNEQAQLPYRSNRNRSVYGPVKRE